MKFRDACILIAATVLGGDVAAAEKCEATLLIGDSLSVGIAPRMSSLLAATGNKLVATGIIGTNTCQWRGKVWPLVMKHRPSKVIVVLGTNDAVVAGWAKKHADCYGDVVNEMLGAKVFWVLPPPMPPEIQKNMPLVKLNIAATGVKMYDSSVDSDIPRAGDGVHMLMGSAGYDRWADRIFDWIKKNSS